MQKKPLTLSHKSIEDVLREIGLTKFAQIFRIIYETQEVQIRLGNRLTEPYRPERGVKQGDSLSCILFVIVMELLIRAVKDVELSKIKINKVEIPSILGYADDITILGKSTNDLQKALNVYEKFTR